VLAPRDVVAVSLRTRLSRLHGVPAPIASHVAHLFVKQSRPIHEMMLVRSTPPFGWALRDSPPSPEERQHLDVVISLREVVEDACEALAVDAG
jgi:hypothetical protein